ncbi:hypothetical protein HDU76_006536, partial [Blyttiomyces sp. JEL0837]
MSLSLRKIGLSDIDDKIFATKISKQDQPKKKGAASARRMVTESKKSNKNSTASSGSSGSGSNSNNNTKDLIGTTEAQIAGFLESCLDQAGSDRRNLLAMRKLHLSLLDTPGNPFETAFWNCVLHLFQVKRGHADVDRLLMKFIEAYFKDLAECTDEKMENLRTVFITFLLQKLKKGFNAKSSVVRYRVCQLLQMLLNYMEEIDDDTYDELKRGIIARSRDKDANVRVQASLALTRFQGPPDDVDESVLAIALESMESDPSA